MSSHLHWKTGLGRGTPAGPPGLWEPLLPYLQRAPGPCPLPPLKTGLGTLGQAANPALCTRKGSPAGEPPSHRGPCCPAPFMAGGVACPFALQQMAILTIYCLGKQYVIFV